VPISKVDGRRFLDSGTIVVADDAVVEILVESDGKPHEVALKFRTSGVEAKTAISWGNPKDNRTVVIFNNVPTDVRTSSPGIHIGNIGHRLLTLAFVIEPFDGPSTTIVGPPQQAWWLSYTLYGG